MLRLPRALLVASVSFGLAAACAPVPIRAPAATPAGLPTGVAALTPTPTVGPRVLPVAPPTPTVRATPVATPQAEPTAPASVSATGAADAPVNVPEPQAPLLDGLLDGLAPGDGSAYGLVLEDLGSGARASLNDDQTFPSASLYKLGVAWLALREVDAGTLSLDAPLAIEDDDTVEPEPAGGFKAGDVPSVRDALEAMLSVSSNAAAHAFLRTLGRATLNQEMDRIGLAQTRVPDDTDSEAVTTAGDIARLLRLISTSPELSVDAKSLLAEGMANISPPDALRDTLPDSVGILDKTGNLSDSSNVGALLETPRGTAIVVVVDTGVNPGDARAVIAEMGEIAYHALLQ
jgi:beta-lactamase class A